MKYHKLFSPNADKYAKIRPQYPDALFSYLASLCPQHEKAWDAACGNGQAALGLAKHFNAVEASDVSEAQIANALPHPRIRYAVQASEQTNFGENAFDLVCAAQALHWFDHELFWREVKRVLKPKGIFAAWGYSWFSINTEVDKIIASPFLDALKPYWKPQNKLLWDAYRDIPFPFAPISPPKIEMKMYWNLNELFAYLQTWSAVRLCVEDQGDAFLQETYRMLQEKWGKEEDLQEVKMDFHLLVGQNMEKGITAPS